MILSHAALKCCRHRASTLSRNRNGFSSSFSIAAATASTTSTSLKLLLLRALPTVRQRQQRSAHPPNYYIYGTQQQLNFYTSSPSLFAENAAATVSTAQLVKQLRESTGAPMMECKKALSSPEVNNDLQLAKEWLRKHGSAKAISKVAGREALEGLVGMHIISPEVHGQYNYNGPAVGSAASAAALVKVSSETDFASRSSVFSTFVQEVAMAAAAAASATNTASSTTKMETQHGDDMDISTFLSNATTRTGKTLHESLNDAILAIRENLSIDTISVLKSTETTSGISSSRHEQQQHQQQHSSVVVFGGYVHGKVAPDVNCGSAAAIVELQVLPTTTSSADADDTADDHSAARISVVQEAAKKLAMHIVAAKPLYINIDSVPPEVVQKEKEILLSKMELEASSSENSMQKKSKKTTMTPEIQDKILSGQLRKYYESVCLTEQPHMVEEGNIKVGKVLTQLGVVVKDFRLMSMMMNK